MPKRKRRDANHFEVTKWLIDLHFSVQDTSQVGNSFPDLVVAKYNINALIEIKTEEGGLEPGQIEFISIWRGPTYVIRTMQDCIDLDKHMQRMSNEYKKTQVARQISIPVQGEKG